MAIPHPLALLVGEWHGPNQLWMMPGEPPAESESRARVGLAAKAKFLTLEYTWAYQGEAHEGLLLVGGASGRCTAAFVDSFHMGDGIMLLEGEETAQGGITVHGSYAAPPDPDWGWRITLSPGQHGQFQMIMHNISPAGEEFLAVQADYTRTA